ncbi:MAG: hypothetical protein WB630_00575 [Candidatus Acidiferrales bacterium]
MPKAKQATKHPRRKLIHWVGTPQGTCIRKDSKADAMTHEQANATRTTISAEATQHGNVPDLSKG